jgi:hypothetical protein
MPDGSESVLEHSAGFQQLVWRARYDVLIRRLVALTGSPVSRKLTFEPAELEDALMVSMLCNFA